MIDYDVNILEESHLEVIIPTPIRDNRSLSGASDIYILELSNENEVIKKYKLYGEEFEIYSDGENIILTHPVWSLSGMGESLIEAERNLIIEAKSVLHHYNVPNSELTQDAIELKEFLLRIC